jgi:hypothetical protein
MASRVPGLAVEVSRTYFDVFVALWDGHRQPIALGAPAVVLNAGALSVATVWLRSRGDDLRPSARLLLRFVQVSAVVALGLVPLSWIPPEHVPMRLLILMPGRVLNINAFAFPALLFGLLASLPGAVWAAALTLLFAGGLLVSNTSALWSVLPAARPVTLAPHVVALAMAAAAMVFVHQRKEQARRDSAAAALRVASAITFAVAAVLAYISADDRSRLFVDRTNDGFFASVSREEGVLLGPGEIYLLQLRTRRPVLIDAGALDTLAYTPETGPAMHRILRDVYGIDMFDPPEKARGGGKLPASVHRATWEAFTADRWQEIRRRYHVTNVLTDGDWVLDLPIIAQSSRYLLYRIPD